MSKPIEVDVVIIGAGTAGQTAYRQARKHTDAIRLINAGSWTTTCAHVGCMPSKLLIAAGQRAEQVRTAQHFGLTTTLSIDDQAVMQRVRRLRDRFTQSVQDAVDGWPDEHKVQGTAKLIDAHQVQVGQHTFTANSIILATGSSPVIPDGWQERLQDRLLTTDTLFELKHLPESIAVVGGGAIGLELAQALQHLGVRVHLFQRKNTLGPLSDPAIQARVREVFEQQLQLHLNSQISQVSRHHSSDTPKARLHYQDADGKTHQLTVDYVLCAVGRKPNIQSLNLACLGLELDDLGMPKAYSPLTGQLGNLSVFWAGDVDGERTLLHEAAREGRMAGDNATRYPDIRANPLPTALSIVFCEPQMAIVGRSYQQLHDQQTRFAVGQVCMRGQGRSMVMDVNEGLCRLYGTPEDGRLVGAELFAPAAEHLAHLLNWAISQHLTVQQILDLPFYHPVIEEGLRTALRDLLRAMHMGSVSVPHCLDCGAGA